MNDYLCQMVDYDSEEDWATVRAYDAEDAAAVYADMCDRRSGGEINEAVILVKQDGEPVSYAITCEFSKDFHANKQEPTS